MRENIRTLWKEELLVAAAVKQRTLRGVDFWLDNTGPVFSWNQLMICTESYYFRLRIYSSHVLSEAIHVALGYFATSCLIEQPTRPQGIILYDMHYYKVGSSKLVETNRGSENMVDWLTPRLHWLLTEGSLMVHSSTNMWQKINAAW
jgi:hypothetical protein